MPQSPLLDGIGPDATVTLAGWTVAEHFGDVAAEVAAVHHGAGLIDRSERGRLELRGPDRLAWLDRIVSNETATLEPGTGVRALLLTPKGRIDCDLRIIADDDRLLLETAFDTAEGLLGKLRGMVLYGDRVSVGDLRPSLVQLGIRGPRSTAIVSEVSGLEVGLLQPLDLATREDWLIVRIDDVGEVGYDLFVPAERGLETWSSLAAQARPCGWRAMEVLRLEAGIPRWGAELTPDYFPGEAELEEALSHTKGCYPGQELVARMRDRGHPNRLLRALDVEGATLPSRGAALHLPTEDKPAGHVTSAALSPTLGLRALAYVRREHAAPGTGLEVEIGEGRVTATVRERGR